MSNIDKHAVQAVADLKAGYTLGHADVAILNELARIALASLEAEPVGEVSEQRDGLVMDGTVDLGGASTHRIIKGASKMKRLPLGTKFYTAPPAPAPAKAEPVAWLWSHRKHPSEVSLVRPEDDERAEGAHWSGWSCQALYAAQPASAAMKDHQIRELVNELRDIAVEYHGTQQLRERIARTIRAAMLHGADTELQRKAAIHDVLCEKYNVESLEAFVDWQRNHIAELEAAPPAPVGEGETAVMPDYPGYVMTQRECFQAGKKAGMADAGNSPVIPDGWVLVPIEPTYQMCEAMGLPWESPRFPDRYKAMIEAINISKK